MQDWRGGGFLLHVLRESLRPGSVVRSVSPQGAWERLLHEAVNMKSSSNADVWPVGHLTGKTVSMEWSWLKGEVCVPKLHVWKDGTAWSLSNPEDPITPMPDLVLQAWCMGFSLPFGLVIHCYVSVPPFRNRNGCSCLFILELCNLFFYFLGTLS